MTESTPTLVVYWSSVSSILETKKQQQKIFMILDGKKIPYVSMDISEGKGESKVKMREICGEKSLPPQIVNNGIYCGDYAAFDQAVECEVLQEFLKI